MSRDAATRWAGHVARALGPRPHVLVAPESADAISADIAFISRDITGLSTKHKVLPATQGAYDVLRGASGLRWVHIHSAGADRPIYVELQRRGVLVTTS